jgi:hypothetical protein
VIAAVCHFEVMCLTLQVTLHVSAAIDIALVQCALIVMPRPRPRDVVVLISPVVACSSAILLLTLFHLRIAPDLAADWLCGV